MGTAQISPRAGSAQGLHPSPSSPPIPTNGPLSSLAMVEGGQPERAEPVRDRLSGVGINTNLRSKRQFGQKAGQAP
jgi:hypothetical protein